MDSRNKPSSSWPWHGWRVRTNDGTEVGTVVGRFHHGQHHGRLRVHRQGSGDTETAVFAVPLDAVVTASAGVLILMDAGTAASPALLVYHVRRRAGDLSQDIDRASPPHFRPRLVHLTHLTDTQLHAILGRVQTVLLDRPQQESRLAVEVVSGDEDRLLALYRALPPTRQREALARVEQAVAMLATATGRVARSRHRARI